MTGGQLEACEWQQPTLADLSQRQCAGALGRSPGPEEERLQWCQEQELETNWDKLVLTIFLSLVNTR